MAESWAHQTNRNRVMTVQPFKYVGLGYNLRAAQEDKDRRKQLVLLLYLRVHSWQIANLREFANFFQHVPMSERRPDSSVKSLVILTDIHLSGVVPLNDNEITDRQDQRGKPPSGCNPKAIVWRGTISGG